VNGFVFTAPAGRIAAAPSRSLYNVVLKIVSMLKRTVDVQPSPSTSRSHVIVSPDGTTNVPDQGDARHQQNAGETISIPVGRFTVQNGASR